MTYRKEYERSISDPAGFWGREAARVAWFRKPAQVLTHSEDGEFHWYTGGSLNTAWLALDYHVENGRGAQPALLYDSPVTGTKRRYTFAELRDETARFAGVLKALGVEKGDRVIIYMPMVPEAAIAMLACARLGAVHSVVFGGFAAHELAIRIEDATPKVLVSASCGIEVDRVIPYKPLVDEAIRQSKHKPEATVILQREQATASLKEGYDHDWGEMMAKATPADAVEVEATDPLYILYTSGTTGKPKGVIRDNGGHAVALHYSMEKVYGVKPGDVFWAASDVGWVVGHSYMVYAPLLYGCTTVFYEGKPVRTPDAGAFWRVVEEYGVNLLFAAPTAFRAIRKEDPEGKLEGKYDLSRLRSLFLAGERLDPPTYEWLRELLDIPIVDHWWQTETGWPIVSNMLGLELFPPKAGSPTRPVCGFDVQILDEDGAPLPPDVEGAVTIRLPLPPGCLPGLWNARERFYNGYLRRYPGYYLSGDGGRIDADGYVFIMGRIDDIINVAGHRLSTGEMEQILASHPAVAECAVIGVADELRGQVPVGFVVVKDGIDVDETTLEGELIELIRHEVGAVANFRRAVLVQRLPKTRSGKILRRTMRSLADGEQFAVPSTIDDPAILDELQRRMQERRVGKWGV